MLRLFGWSISGWTWGLGLWELWRSRLPAQSFRLGMDMRIRKVPVLGKVGFKIRSRGKVNHNISVVADNRCVAVCCCNSSLQGK